MRDFLYSEIANFHKIQNIPEDPDLAIATGRQLCQEILEPLQATFGRLSIRSGYRSPEVNRFGNEHDLNCSSNEANYAGHIWDKRDANDCTGATACIVVNWYLEQYEETQDFRPLAWWIHDHLPYARMEFFPKLCAFNISWHEKSRKASILSYTTPKGHLTKIGMDNHKGDHSEFYQGFPKLKLA